MYDKVILTIFFFKQCRMQIGPYILNNKLYINKSDFGFVSYNTELKSYHHQSSGYKVNVIWLKRISMINNKILVCQ
jgi:hypothetical protein